MRSCTGRPPTGSDPKLGPADTFEQQSVSSTSTGPGAASPPRAAAALLTDDATAISDGGGLTKTLLRYDTPQRIAATARAGFKPTPARRRFAGGTSAVHYALVNGAPAILFVVGDQVVGAVAFDITNGRVRTACGGSLPSRAESPASHRRAGVSRLTCCPSGRP
ncbi:hypothetical protein ACIBI9_24895 [Nonomuraea sp. NPDC050451]|uniref:hypothetical protein n=1 Tax=Nonomuraea sp. NPDC050451 TaxID=3364364 RepID=UPI003790CA9E